MYKLFFEHFQLDTLTWYQRKKNSSGKLDIKIKSPKSLYFLFAFRGDHTYADCYLTVVPPSTECVVFSIDGSFTASVSIMGKDPKVRAGAVDVVR